MAKNILLIHYDPSAFEISTLESQLNNRRYNVERSLNDVDFSSQNDKDDVVEIIKCADVVIILIGKGSNSKPSIDWKIDKAKEQGKRIVGVFIDESTEADIPRSLESYASAIVCWDIERIIAAIEGGNIFLNPDCIVREQTNKERNYKC